MKDDRFEWDDAKAASNYAKHGVSFEFARRVMGDAFAIERIDQRFAYGEERFVVIGHGARDFALGGLCHAPRPHAYDLGSQGDER